MPVIDAHLHLCGDHPESVRLLDELDIKLLNVCVAYDMTDDWRQREAAVYERLARRHPHRYAWCTTFSLPAAGVDPGAYARRVIAELERDLDEGGAVACKVWKNVGMDLKDAEGRHVLVDHPIFEPIFAWLENRGTPLLAHIGEPLACWQPISTPSPHQDYYRANPQWHMHGRTDMPSHAQLIAARDRVIERHRRLRVIGAHLGSVEYSIPEMARRFDAWPNYFVDTSARLEDLMSFDPAEARAFLIRYQDRILFGTDIVQRELHSTMDTGNRQAMLKEYRQLVHAHQSYFGTADRLSIHERHYQGVNLPGDVYRKIMYENARRVYPGL